MYFRYLVSFLTSMAFAIVFMLRVNLNVSIVSMTMKSKSKNPSLHRGTCRVDVMPNDTAIFEDISKGEFDWDEYTQGMILSSFYYGYVISNLFGGRIAERIGSKNVIELAVTVTAIVTMLTPVAARLSYKALIAVRVLEGFTEGLVYPSLTVVCSRWFPKCERSHQFAIILSGMSFGSLLGTLIAGVLCASTIFGGWPSSFYIPGLFGFLWLFFWVVFVSEFPAENRWISSNELRYILIGQGNEKPTKNFKLPWAKIWKCVPFWALLVSGFFSGFSSKMLSAEIPTFVGKILGFDILTNGYLSAIPLALEGIVSVLSGIASDFLIKRGLSETKTRKLFYTLGSILSTISILCIIPSGCNLPLTSAMLFLSKAFDGISYWSPGLSLIDMTPDFAGTLSGIYNCVFCIQGIIAPIVVGILTEHNQTLEQWEKVFYIAAALNVVAVLIFVIFESSKLQPWGIFDENKVITCTDIIDLNLKDTQNRTQVE